MLPHMPRFFKDFSGVFEKSSPASQLLWKLYDQLNTQTINING